MSDRDARLGDEIRNGEEPTSHEPGQWGHVPVLLEVCLEFLQPERGGVFVDCTVGLGGHAEGLLQRAPEAQLLAIDRDPQALQIAQQRLAGFAPRVHFVHGNLADVADLVAGSGHGKVDGVLADFGVSSLQLDVGSRGFSFRYGGPLDMRMDSTQTFSARDVVNTYTEAQLERILRDFGEERRARRIAREVVRSRSEKSIDTTTDLRELVHRTIGPTLAPRSARSPRGRGIDSATRTFQALRIEVNQELAAVEKFLGQVLSILDQDGRLVVMSYHSLEDRLVKAALRSASTAEVDPITGRRLAETRLIESLTKKPVRPGEEEIAANPRSRSARLRAARRL